MINFEELIKSLIVPLVSYPEDVSVSLDDEGSMLSYTVYVNGRDLGRVIGKNGHIAQAIRTILFAGASKEGKRIHLNIVEAESL